MLKQLRNSYGRKHTHPRLSFHPQPQLLPTAQPHEDGSYMKPGCKESPLSPFCVPFPDITLPPKPHYPHKFLSKRSKKNIYFK